MLLLNEACLSFSDQEHRLTHPLLPGRMHIETESEMRGWLVRLKQKYHESAVDNLCNWTVKVWWDMWCFEYLVYSQYGSILFSCSFFKTWLVTFDWYLNLPELLRWNSGVCFFFKGDKLLAKRFHYYLSKFMNEAISLFC